MMAMWAFLIIFIGSCCYGVYAQGRGAINDRFILKDGVIRQIRTDDNGQEWMATAALNRLNVLSNDELITNDINTCRRKPQTTTHPGNLMFTEVGQGAGITHKHRPGNPTAPHCTFDNVIPFVNSTQFARMKGGLCTIDHISGGVAAGDYDNDGLVDLFFTVASGRSVLYKNNGDGTYADVSAETGVGPDMYGSGAGFVDVDQDGDLDLYVTTLGGTRHYLYINYGGHFKEEAVARGVGLEAPNKRKLAGMTPSFGDYDNDGYLDIYTTEWLYHNNGKPSVSRLLRNMGPANPGHFVDMTDYAGVNMDTAWMRRSLPENAGTHTFGASFTDFNNDGYPELLVTGDLGTSKMFWNNMNGTFTECTGTCGLMVDQLQAMGHAIGDVNNDGRLDWFSSGIYEDKTKCGVLGCVYNGLGSKFFSGTGNKMFEDATTQAGVKDGGWGWGAVFFDFNNDGFLDLVHTNGFDTTTTGLDDMFSLENMRLFENTHVLTQPGNIYGMTDMASQFGMNFRGQGRGLLKADLDNDGDEDVVVATNFGPAQVFRNDGGNKKNWLRVNAMNRCLQNSNKLCESIGAKVIAIHPDGKRQFQEVGSSSHFFGQSERTSHFGLGTSISTVTILITWPGEGVSMRINSVPTNVVVRAVRPLSTTEVLYSDLDTCPLMTIGAVTRQPEGRTVTVNADRKSLSFQNSPNMHIFDIGQKSFDYSIVIDPPVNAVTNFNTTASVDLDLRSQALPASCHVTPTYVVTDDRRIDGQSNNKLHPGWGSTNANLKRLHPSDYADNISMLAGSCGTEKVNANMCPFPTENRGLGSYRRSPREISNVLFAQTSDVPSKRRMNDMTMHFGQFFSHDFDLTTTLNRQDFVSIINDAWMPISVPMGDVFFDPTHTGTKYLPFLRSVYDKCTSTYPGGKERDQLNVLTAYMDASVVYGMNEERSQHLRTFVNGKLKQGADGILPKNTLNLPNANNINRPTSHLYMAGDIRSNEQPGLTAMHSLFVREHNRLCDEYKTDNLNANDETIFQAARQVLIAEFQSIGYNDYLPALLGGKQHIPKYTGYKENVDPQVNHVFGTAAFRYGHSQVNSLLFRLNSKYETTEHGHAFLRDCYFAPEKLADEGGLEPLLRGMFHFPAQEMDTLLVDELRNLLFPNGGPGGHDLAALNIQRGRDHGLPHYNAVRKLVGLQAVTDFSEITSDANVVQKLRSLYNSVDDIDLWVGGLAEEHEPGSELGPLFRAIIMETFLRVRDGDRFWYEAIMTQAEIDKVESMTLSKMIQLNTDFKDVPSFSFFSMRDCSDVVNFQCIRKPITDAEILRKENEALVQSNVLLHSKYQKAKKEFDEADNDKDEMRGLSIGLGAFAAVLLILCLLLILYIVLSAMRKKKGRNVKGKAFTVGNPHAGDKYSLESSNKSSTYAYP